MTISRFNPIVSLADRNWPSIFDHSLESFQPGSVNIIDRENSLDFEMALPGIAKDSIELKIEGNRLFIHAEKKLAVAEDEKVIRNDFGNYRVKQTFLLPQNVDKDQIKADYQAGILLVSFTKKQADRPRLITIS
jgi:HSP20 family protein